MIGIVSEPEAQPCGTTCCRAIAAAAVVEIEVWELHCRRPQDRYISGAVKMAAKTVNAAAARRVQNGTPSWID